MVIICYEVEFLFLYRFVSSFWFLYIKYVEMGGGGKKIFLVICDKI